MTAVTSIPKAPVDLPTLISEAVSLPVSTQPIGKIELSEGRSLKVEPGAILASHNLNVETRLGGSFLSLLGRYFFGGESFFQNTCTAKQGGGWITFEESMPGQIAKHELQPGESLTLVRSAYVASEPNVKLATEMGGVRSWFKGQGIFKLVASTTDHKVGSIYLNSPHGAVKKIVVSRASGPVIIDNNCLVGYVGDLKCTLSRIGSFKGVVLSGEGFVNEFEGDGQVYVGAQEPTKRRSLLSVIMDEYVPSPATMAEGLAAVAIIALAIKNSHAFGFLKSLMDLKEGACGSCPDFGDKAAP